MASKSKVEKSSTEKTAPTESSLNEKVLGSNAQAQDNMFEGVSAPGTDHQELLSMLRDGIADAQQVFSKGLSTATRVLLEPGAWTQEAAQAGPDLSIHLNNSKSWSSLIQGASTAVKAAGVPGVAVDAAKTAIYAGQALDKALAGARDASAGLSKLQGLDLLGSELDVSCSEARQSATQLEGFQRVELGPEQDVELSRLLGMLVTDWRAASSVPPSQVAAWALEMLGSETSESPVLVVDLSAIRSVKVGELESSGDTMPWQAWVMDSPVLQGQLMSAFPGMTIADWRSQGWEVLYETHGLDGAEAADRILSASTRESELALSAFMVSK